MPSFLAKHCTMLGTGELPRRGPRMNGPALLALFPEIPLPRAFALADVSPAPLSDALRFILSSSAGAQRCSPIVRSPEPGLLGAPSRGTGAGQGAWEPLTAVSRRSLPSHRRRCRRLPPWLQRRHRLSKSEVRLGRRHRPRRYSTEPRVPYTRPPGSGDFSSS